MLRTLPSAAHRLQQTPQRTYYADLCLLYAFCSSEPTAADLYVLLLSATAAYFVHKGRRSREKEQVCWLC